MMELAIAIAAIPIAGIVGWVFVERGKQRADPGLERRVEDLAAAVYELRGDLDAVAGKQEQDRQFLEERLDVAERMLTRGRGG